MTLSIGARQLARMIHNSGIKYDALLGAAYAGIPLCTAVSTALFDLFGENKEILYDEAGPRAHGEVRLTNARDRSACH
jgi:orotate phosphoribosyltransferase